MADEGRRRALRKAEEEKRELKEQYDQWCIDHGIPPPPDREPEVHRGAGCLCLPLVVLGLTLLILYVFLIK